MERQLPCKGWCKEVLKVLGDSPVSLKAYKRHRLLCPHLPQSAGA